MFPDPFLPRVAVRVGKGSGYARLGGMVGHPVQEYFAIERIEDSRKPWMGKYRVKLESFLAHARTRVVTPSHTSIRPSPFHPRSELHFAFSGKQALERGS